MAMVASQPYHPWIPYRTFRTTNILPRYTYLCGKILTVQILMGIRLTIGALIQVPCPRLLLLPLALGREEEQRCHIFVQKSRLLFGVCDAYDVLREGECAVKVTHEDNEHSLALKGTQVIVTRNPCLHPGDWQIKIVEHPGAIPLGELHCILHAGQTSSCGSSVRRRP